MKDILKNPRFWTGVIVVIIIITIITQSKTTEKPPTEEQNTNTQQTEQTEPTKTTISSPNTWDGLLQASDNMSKGNLMLMTADKKIYIKTSRDFSSLLNKKVVVTYEGTLDSFLLGDIVASEQN